MKRIMILMLIVCCGLIWAELPWQDIRFSAQLPDQTVSIRCQIMQETQTRVVFETESGLDSNITYFVPGMMNTIQGFIQSPEIESNFGFVTEIMNPLPDEVAYLAAPVFNRTGETPSFQSITQILDDLTGDIGQGLPFLDITNIYASTDEEKIYLSMQNDEGGYPVMETAWGPFYSYMFLILPPSEEYYPFGMLFTIDQPPYIQSGLYKMTGENFEDLQMIADIEATIDEDNDLLITECYWDDLLTDPDFIAWFDPDEPEFTFMVTTNLITMGGIEDGDYSDYCTIYPHQFSLQEQENETPEINDIEIIQDSILSFTYSDNNFNFPLIAQAVIDDSIMVELYPQSYNYEELVTFQSSGTIYALENNLWQTITVTVSDNYTEIIQQTITNNVGDDPDNIPQYALTFRAYPNPFNPQISFFVNLPNESNLNPFIEIYNVKGQLLKTLSVSSNNDREFSCDWDAKSYSSGIYLAKLKIDGKTCYSKKITLLK